MQDFENDDELIEEPERKKFHFAWVPALLIRPKRTIHEIVRSEYATWLTPLLLLSLLAVLYVVVTAQPRMDQAINQPLNLPEDFQYWSPDMQENFLKASQPNVGAVAIYVMPAVSALVGVWLGWVLLAGLLHLALTLAGGRESRTTDFNLAAWSALPFAVRFVVQILAVLFTRHLINAPGLSGFVNPQAAGLGLYLGLMLRYIDLYLIWQMALLVLGATSGARLPLGKAILMIVLTILVLLALKALPGFLGGLLGGLNTQRGFFFF